MLMIWEVMKMSKLLNSVLDKLTKKRDAINKKHGCLVPFDRLSDYEKLKDLNVLKYIDNED